MYTISYNDFLARQDKEFRGFDVNFQPGLKAMYVDSYKCLINIDAKTAFVFYE